MTVSKVQQNVLLKWRIDFGRRQKAAALDSDRQLALGPERSISSIAQDPDFDPPGYSPQVANFGEEESTEEDHRLINKRSWDVALGPLKQVPMSLFMMYMAGNSISIFPIMMVGMMVFRPVKSLFAVTATFSSMEEPGQSLILQKLAFMLGNLAAVALALYKCSSMGLLPTHASDWLAFVDTPDRAEYAAGGWHYV